jgi:hypothetical protein
MTITREKAFSVGKYLVSPSTRQTDCGGYAASVSIRSGQGAGTHDRLFRFDARFATREGARHHAVQQGIHWVNQPCGAALGEAPAAHS